MLSFGLLGVSACIDDVINSAASVAINVCKLISIRVDEFSASLKAVRKGGHHQ